jgi:hypothetical protein
VTSVYIQEFGDGRDQKGSRIDRAGRESKTRSSANGIIVDGGIASVCGEENQQSRPGATSAAALFGGSFSGCQRGTADASAKD